MATGDGTEKMVSREETPIDPSTRTGPRVVFPPLTPSGSVSLPSTVVPGAPPPTTPSAANGTFSNNEPHKIRTLSVRGDQAEAGVPAGAAPPTAKPAARAAATSSRPPAGNPNAANANAPLSLAPQAEASAAPEPPVRVATTSPIQSRSPPAPALRTEAIWCRYPRNGARRMHRPPSGLCKASSPRCSGHARRSSSAPISVRRGLTTGRWSVPSVLTKRRRSSAAVSSRPAANALPKGINGHFARAQLTPAWAAG